MSYAVTIDYNTTVNRRSASAYAVTICESKLTKTAGLLSTCGGECFNNRLGYYGVFSSVQDAVAAVLKFVDAEFCVMVKREHLTVPGAHYFLASGAKKVTYSKFCRTTIIARKTKAGVWLAA